MSNANFYLQVDAFNAIRLHNGTAPAFQFTDHSQDSAAGPNSASGLSSLTVKSVGVEDTIAFIALTIQPGYAAFIQHIDLDPSHKPNTNVFNTGLAWNNGILSATVQQPGTGYYVITYIVVSPSGIQAGPFTSNFAISVS